MRMRSRTTPSMRADQHACRRDRPGRSRPARRRAAHRRSGRASCRSARPPRRCRARGRAPAWADEVAVLAVHRHQHPRPHQLLQRHRGPAGWRGPRRGSGPSLSSMTVTPFSQSWFRIRATATSLPGMVFEEKRKVSPAPSSKPMYLPCASCAVAARRSPWLPVASTSRLRARHAVGVERVERSAGSRRAPRRHARSSASCSSRGRARRPAARRRAPACGQRPQPRDVRGEGGGDDQALGLPHQRADRLDQRRLGAAGVGVEDVGRSRRPSTFTPRVAERAQRLRRRTARRPAASGRP